MSLTPNFARYSAERSNTRKLLRTFTAKSFADLRVNVNPKILSGSTNPLAIKYITRVLMVSVFPDPAPAITTAGRS
ncbi:unannotated protein [freshwater metagenome]|uniref:Unannotated protein n=1 Tax=freshwater metagenome TaxID=449393 RepID=A0A6J7SGQ6_9ZZZZ